MRRTEALQGVRMTVFLNILNRWESAALNQEEAAELLGVSERTFRRWTRRYEEEGEAGTVGSARRRAGGSRAIGRRKWRGFIASATRVLRSSTSTGISSRTRASAGATPG
jgi:transposase-like protein